MQDLKLAWAGSPYYRASSFTLDNDRPKFCYFPVGGVAGPAGATAGAAEGVAEPPAGAAEGAAGATAGAEPEAGAEAGGVAPLLPAAESPAACRAFFFFLHIAHCSGFSPDSQTEQVCSSALPLPQEPQCAIAEGRLIKPANSEIITSFFIISPFLIPKKALN